MCIYMYVYIYIYMNMVTDFIVATYVATSPLGFNEKADGKKNAKEHHFYQQTGGLSAKSSFSTSSRKSSCILYEADTSGASRRPLHCSTKIGRCSST